MIRITSMRFLSSNSVNQVLGKLKVETPAYLENFKRINLELIQKKFAYLNNRYTRFLGLDEVKEFQDRVVALQERLLETQEKRREVGRHLAETRRKSNILQDEIHKVRRSEDLERFLQLMKEETEIVRLENDIARSFQEYDQAERELFTAFTNAVRDSHEKQRAQLEYTKYFGIILSITGSFLVFCYSTWRKSDLIRFLDERLPNDRTPQANFDLKSLIEPIQIERTKLYNEINSQTASFINYENERKKDLLMCVAVTIGILFFIKVISS